MTSTIIPCIRYRDAARMIDWLCDTFGFEKQMVVTGEDGAIVHSQLKRGTGMITIGSVLKEETPWGCQITQPENVGGCETQSPYMVVEDLDAIYERARVAGAEIVMELTDQPHGGRDFLCRDPEGHLWSMGTYNPWAEQK